MPWLYAEDVNTSTAPRSQRAKAVIQQIVNEIRTNVLEKRCFLGCQPEDLSPWGLCFAYHVCLAHLRYETKTTEFSELADSLKQTMVQINVRWNAAGMLRLPMVMFCSCLSGEKVHISSCSRHKKLPTIFSLNESSSYKVSKARWTWICSSLPLFCCISAHQVIHPGSLMFKPGEVSASCFPNPSYDELLVTGAY